MPTDVANEPARAARRSSMNPSRPKPSARPVYAPRVTPSGIEMGRSAAPALSVPTSTVPPAPAVAGSGTYAQRAVEAGCASGGPASTGPASVGEASPPQPTVSAETEAVPETSKRLETDASPEKVQRPVMFCAILRDAGPLV